MYRYLALKLCNSNESREWKITLNYIMSPVNCIGEVDSLLDYSPVNSSLHKLTVNKIFMNMFFDSKTYTYM
jgi:hypothetical protein